jgi:predicted enzyme related to lactoylglutathione lyase
MANLLVNIDVGDLAAAVAFYTAAFELRVARRLGSTVVELVGTTAPIYLIHASEGSQPFNGAAQARNYQRHWTPVHLDFVVPDLQSALQRALSAGATQEAPVRSEAWGKLAVLADPWGNGVCLLQFTERGYDAIAASDGHAVEL